MTVLDDLIAEVTADPESIGLILHGSPAAGVHGDDSDYDLVRVVTEESFAARRDRGQLRDKRAPRADIVYARVQGWEEGFLADALIRVLATGDPTFQQALERRVEALLDSRGVAHQWGAEDGLEAVKEHRFE